ncbi:helix-turn-helix domain-containing protein [Mesorhizobium onobrychidis]|uniref:Helix-turn-helix transcriptional regulator n=1 Tax=Mesorhizobium onobrychidis TaxID=2775404 RepID=A0ABY5QTU5_9HYPH|nr:helix-turn-helix transcriptional regulator [Mesorhizobium onobrychidis]UVC13512.1 helix-turn-helix transcriptional regulator [Mesorhizobium onobrychidis]
MADLTPEANRAARAILKWSVRDVAALAGIAFSTVHRFEQTGIATETTKAKIVAAYALHNVDITNGEGTGARLRKPAAPGHNLPDGEAGIIENNEM